MGKRFHPLTDLSFYAAILANLFQLKFARMWLSARHEQRLFWDGKNEGGYGRR